MSDISQNRTPVIVGTVIALWSLSLVSICIRFLVRYRTRQSFWWDDWLALGSWVSCSSLFSGSWLLIGGGLSELINEKVFFTPKAVLFLICAHLGAGKHAAVVSPVNYQQVFKLIYWTDLIYPIDIGLAKASIVLLFYRLFRVQKHFKLICFALLGVILCWAIAIFFT